VLCDIGHCVNYIGVLSANYIQPFLDFSHREYFAKIAPINNISWSAFSINRVKMLNINIKLKEVLNILKIIGGSPPDPDLFKQAKTRHKYLVRLSL
jgi:hypothetical protein